MNSIGYIDHIDENRENPNEPGARADQSWEAEQVSRCSYTCICHKDRFPRSAKHALLCVSIVKENGGLLAETS